MDITTVLHSIVNNSSAVIYVKDDQGKYILINRLYETIFHVRNDEIIGRTDFDYFPREAAQAMQDNDRLVMDSRKPVEFEEAVPHDDGLHTYISLKFPLTDTDGTVYGVCGISTDITERKQMEEALRESENRLQALSDATFESIFISEKGVCLDQNRTAERMFGYSHEEAVGRMGTEWIVPEDREVVMQNMMSGNEQPYQVTALRKDGSTFPAEIQAREIKYIDKRLRVTALRDITLRKQAEEEIRKAKEAAESANRTKSEFLANMSHEIRTPLNGVLGVLHILKDSQLSREQRSYIELADSSGKGLLQIINDILDFSKVEAGKVEICREYFKLDQVIQPAVDIFSAQARSKGVRLVSKIEPDVPLELVGDSGRLRQVMFNLIGNAVKFTNRGEVTVRAARSGSDSGEGRASIRFTVMDNGVGIPEDKLATIFEPFTQVEGSYNRRSEGTGLGLSIVKRLIELMGGRIEIDSRLEKGTAIAFTLEFPEAARTAICGPEKLGRAVAPATDRTLDILLAEDNSVNQLLTKRILEGRNHRVTVAENGRQAIDQLARDDFDLILMDVQMPVMDGVQATGLIRADRTGRFNPEIPIIAMTAHALKGDRESFLRAGMDEYISKPIDVDELFSVLDRVTNRS